MLSGWKCPAVSLVRQAGTGGVACPARLPSASIWRLTVTNTAAHATATLRLRFVHQHSHRIQSMLKVFRQNIMISIVSGQAIFVPLQSGMAFCLFQHHPFQHYCAGTFDGICPSVAQHAQHVVAVAASPLHKWRRRRRRHWRQLFGAAGWRQCSVPAQQSHPATAVTALKSGTQKQQRHARCDSLELWGFCLLGPNFQDSCAVW